MTFSSSLRNMGILICITSQVQSVLRDSDIHRMGCGVDHIHTVTSELLTEIKHLSSSLATTLWNPMHAGLEISHSTHMT